MDQECTEDNVVPTDAASNNVENGAPSNFISEAAGQPENNNQVQVQVQQPTPDANNVEMEQVGRYKVMSTDAQEVTTEIMPFCSVNSGDPTSVENFRAIMAEMGYDGVDGMLEAMAHHHPRRELD